MFKEFPYKHRSRTIFICHNYLNDGLSGMSTELAHFLLKKKYNIVFLSHRPKLRSSFKKVNDNFLIVTSWRSRKRPTTIVDAIWFLRLFLKHRPFLIIGHFVGGNLSVIIAKILAMGKVKTLVYYHTLIQQLDHDTKYFSKLKLKYLRKRKSAFYYLFSDKIICPSNLAKLDLLKFSAYSRAVVVHNPVLDNFEPYKNHNKNHNNVISYMGRLNESKGLTELVLAFKKFSKMNPDSNLILKIYGTGNLQLWLTKNILDTENIIYKGNIPHQQIHNYIRKSNFVIVPSIIDNFPTIALETLMHSRLLLISSKTGLSEILNNNCDCLIFEPTINEMVDLFNRIENEDYSPEISSNGRKTFENYFTVDMYCKNMLKIIECSLS